MMSDLYSQLDVYKRQEQGLHARRVAIDEEELVEFGKLMVDLACLAIVALKLQADHAGEDVYKRQYLTSTKEGDALAAFDPYRVALALGCTCLQCGMWKGDETWRRAF